MPDTDRRRLIEVAFPLKQASLDSVHEKNVRHGHISTLHIWPARRPLAASRAALIATLLPDPDNEQERQRILERLGGKVVTRNTVKREGGREVHMLKEETEGGILHWGRESGPDLDFFREEIRKAYGGRAPRVLDPFAGGGAIPLEAMRLGCEVTAIDINPVAWFILKCTLEYPQKLAGQKRPLPRFALESPEFMAEYAKSNGLRRKGRKAREQSAQPTMLEAPEADLAWHVRAWGHWVLQRARADLERFYPTVDGKPTVAYLWARTVTCKNCRATLPLLKTLWLCKKDNKRWRLAMKPRANRSGVDFEVVEEPKAGGSSAQQREHDRSVGQGTMSRSGAWCPVCGKAGSPSMTLDDIREEGKAGRLGAQMTAVVVDGSKGKEYRLPVPEELSAAEEAGEHLGDVFEDVPFGLPEEPLPTKEALGFRVPLYGFDQWRDLFTPRQLAALGIFVRHTRAVRDAMRAEGYADDWLKAVSANLCCTLDKLLDHSSTVCSWNVPNEQVRQVFSRFALPMTWDFVEVVTTAERCGAYPSMLDSTIAGLETLRRLVEPGLVTPKLMAMSAITAQTSEKFDIVLTDPPYYDAIPYSDLMDFFYVWLRRAVDGLSAEMASPFREHLGPKWDHDRDDGELIDDASRFGGDAVASKAMYEDGMFRAFRACDDALDTNGRMVVVFANKQPDAWETLVSSMIRAGFVVDGSWPIQTERGGRTRALASASLASSVWLVSKKRPETARPGWDNRVLEEMRERMYGKWDEERKTWVIRPQLREFWDAGIRGPDFVWAATGPALEAYSKHPVVKKADEPDAVLTVSEFLGHVRRIVVDYVVGRVLSRDGESDEAAELDNQTIYYLLHRHDFGFAEAPAGACILYAQSCGLRDRDLADSDDLVNFTGGRSSAEDEDGEEEEDEEDEETVEEVGGSGSKIRLKRWEQRRGRNLGFESDGRTPPLIDQAHRIMHLWREGDVRKVDDYIEERGLRRNPLFPRLLQALVELARKDNQPEERTLLETIMNHFTARGAHPQMRLG